MTTPIRQSIATNTESTTNHQRDRHALALKVAHLNACHLLPSIDDIKILISNTDLDILCVGETFLSDQVDSKYLIFPGYVVERRDRQSHGGGVCVIYRDWLKADVLTVPSNGSTLEALWLRFNCNSPFIVGTLYRPPASNVASVLDDLHHQLTFLLAKQYPLYVLGDVNLDLLKPSATGVRKYQQILEELTLQQLISSPTRTTETTSTLIDHIFTSRPDLVHDPRVIKCNISDHDLVAASIDVKRVRRQAETITIRPTRGVNYDALCLDLLQADWSQVNQAETVIEKWNAWYEVWQPQIDKHMPLRTIRIRHPPSPWLNNNDQLRECMTRRDQAREVRDRDRKDNEKEQTYRECRNAVKKDLYKASSEYFANCIRNNSSKTWIDIRKYFLASKKPEPKTKPLHLSDRDWADKLNHHFVEAGADVAAALSAVPQGATLEPRPPSVCADAFRVQPVTLPELWYALKRMGKSRACGNDGITIQMLRSTFAVIGPHLQNVINCSLRTGQVPPQWKEASVIPLYKKGDRSDPGNFRPISILSVVSKLCEKVVCLQLSSYLEKNHILCENQHGFRSGHSTETAMLETVNFISDSMDQRHVTTLLTADTSRAFDTVEHSRLLEKLGWYGIEQHWFKDWLTNRTQKIQGGRAESLPVTHGVVQGSLLGPKLFLIFTNDLASHLSSGKLIMYADDAQFLDSDTPANICHLKLRVESTLKVAHDWFTQNRLKINPSKTELLVIKSNRNRWDPKLTIQFGDTLIKPTTHAKILGVYVDSALTWEKQISQITRRCYGILIGLHHLRCKIPPETRKLLVQALVFPHIQYCMTVWGGCNITQKHRIQKVINFGARIVKGLRRREHVTPALEALGWPKVSDLLKKRDVSMIERLLTDDSCSALSRSVARRSAISSRSTRGTDLDMLELPRVRTEQAKHSFRFRGVVSWNNRTSDS